MDAKSIAAMSTSVLGEAFLPVDKRGNPLYWSMTTFDARAGSQTVWWEENFGADEIYQITGQPLTSAMPIYTLPKIQWIRENEPSVYRKTERFLCWEDYVNLKLCGKPVTDPSVATRTMMFDIRRKKWSAEILEAADLNEDILPEVQLSGTAVGEVIHTAAEETGLAEGTLVVTGGHDQPCGALGAGIVKTGPTLDATGTVECIGMLQKRLTLTEKMRLEGYAVHCYVVEGMYFMFGFNPTGGAVLKWFRDHFAQQEKETAREKGIDVYDVLTSKAATAPPGSMGLFLLPYFAGSGTPTFNRKAQGVLLGLTLAHGKNAIIRAILEGLSYELRDNIETIEGHGVPVTELRAIGGGAKSRFWLQLKADISGKKVVVPNVTEAVALGAAMLAGVGAKTYKNAEEAVERIYRERETFVPELQTKKIYDRNFSVYKKLYPRLNGLFDEMAVLSA